MLQSVVKPRKLVLRRLQHVKIEDRHVLAVFLRVAHVLLLLLSLSSISRVLIRVRRQISVCAVVELRVGLKLGKARKLLLEVLLESQPIQLLVLKSIQLGLQQKHRIL